MVHARSNGALSGAAVIAIGHLQIHARLNPRKLGMPHIVTLRLNVERDRITAVAETLVSMTEIQFVAIVIGHYSRIMDAHFGSHDDLLALFDKIHTIPGIIHYDSCTVLKLLKTEYQYADSHYSWHYSLRFLYRIETAENRVSIRICLMALYSLGA